MLFADIRAQETAIRTLQRALAAQKLHHAYLFSGPSGVGKRRAALALAMAINCQSGGEDACGACLSCQKISRGVHPDLFLVTLPEGKKQIPIEAVRELSARLSSPPYEGRAKVAIIDPADRLGEPAANALLKTLEEPRPNSFLILVTARASSLLSTVRSRCQTLRFRALPVREVEAILTQQGADPAAAGVAAGLSGGSVDQALLYLHGDLDRHMDLILDLIENAGEATPLKGLVAAAACSGKRDEALALIDLMTVVLGELLWLSAHPHEEMASALRDRVGDRLSRLSERLSIARTADFAAAAHRAHEEITNNNMNPQLALEAMLIAMRRPGGEGLEGSGFGVA